MFCPLCANLPQQAGPPQCRAMVKPIWRFTVLAIAGWMNRQQEDAIEYLRVENRILRERLGQKRIRLNDSQRVRLREESPAGLQLPEATDRVVDGGIVSLVMATLAVNRGEDMLDDCR